jgi:hypothetical protein
MGIHTDFIETLVAEAVAYSTLIRYLHMMSFTDPIELKENQDRPSSFSEINGAILNALDDEPFSSLHDLSRYTYLSKTIIHRYLTDSPIYHLATLFGTASFVKCSESK